MLRAEDTLAGCCMGTRGWRTAAAGALTHVAGTKGTVSKDVADGGGPLQVAAARSVRVKLRRAEGCTRAGNVEKAAGEANKALESN